MRASLRHTLPRIHTYLVPWTHSLPGARLGRHSNSSHLLHKPIIRVIPTRPRQFHRVQHNVAQVWIPIITCRLIPSTFRTQQRHMVEEVVVVVLNLGLSTHTPNRTHRVRLASVIHAISASGLSLGLTIAAGIMKQSMHRRLSSTNAAIARRTLVALIP